ncbi:extracellular solute-binding protein [uncultured Clostridium sp.]|jgi:ABC-type glycerol-3-phosphate transport system substrate-binding protein|uniref:ABC transporter substrate-binding protein n=1 Tax=uncultured Clostridium sp. TaxID=59620 RepID=UPI00261BAD47|nr:extracellular solute-binding protein [uncultured Clostridium sp.]
MKKRLISVLILAPILFVGCGADAKAPEVVQNKESEVSGTITVVTDRTDKEAEILFDEMEEKFKAKYPEVEDIVFESSNDYDEHIRTRMNTKDYGDVLMVPFSMNANSADYVDYFEPIGNIDELEEKYMDVTEADHDGIAYGIPVALNSLGIIYNERVFKEAGIEKMPINQDEFIAACKKIKEKTKAVPFYTNYNSTVGVWGGALSSYGGEDFKEDTLEVGTAFKDGQPIKEVLDLFYDLSKNGLIEEDPITGDYGKSLQMIGSGEAAMIMMGSQELAQIRETVTNGDEINIASFPVQYEGETSIAFGAPAVLGINKNSENKATAKAFMELMLSKESGYAQDLAGLSPVLSDLTEEEKKIFDDNNVILTAPETDPKVEKLYGEIANEVGVARLNTAIQKVINIGMYPDQHESYDEYIVSLESNWAKAVKEYDK